MLKKLILAALCTALLTACTSLRPWTANDQAHFEKEQGRQPCPAFFTCYDLRGQEKDHKVLLEKE